MIESKTTEDAAATPRSVIPPGAWQKHAVELVEGLKQEQAIRTQEIEAAFRTTPRHLFLRDYWFVDSEAHSLVPCVGRDHLQPSSSDLSRIYSDTVLVTLMDQGRPVSSSTLPSLTADILEHLELARGQSVMEIGGGVGYTAGLVGSIVGPENVTTIEYFDGLSKTAHESLSAIGMGDARCLSGDGWGPIADVGNLDRIVVSVGCVDLAPQWPAYLAEDGMLAVPFQVCSGANPLLVLRRGSQGRLVGRIATWATFMEAAGGGSGPAELRRHFRAPAGTELDRSKLCEEELWPGFADLDEGLTFRSPATRLGFCLYLAVVDELAMGTSRGFGLYEDESRSFALLAKDRIVSMGSRELRQRLRTRYEQWLLLGRPGLGQFWVEATPRGASVRSNAVGVMARDAFQYVFGIET